MPEEVRADYVGSILSEVTDISNSGRRPFFPFNRFLLSARTRLQRARTPHKLSRHTRSIAKAQLDPGLPRRRAKVNCGVGRKSPRACGCDRYGGLDRRVIPEVVRHSLRSPSAATRHFWSGVAAELNLHCSLLEARDLCTRLP